MLDIKQSSRVSSILNDLKMRKQKLLPHYKTKRQNEDINILVEKNSNPSIDQSQFISSLNYVTKQQRIKQKCVVFHIDKSIFQNPDQQKQIEEFLKTFTTKKELFSLTQIKSTTINKLHNLKYSLSQKESWLETKILKLNLKYALTSNKNKNNTFSSQQKDIYHTFIISSSISQNSAKFIFNGIDWNENTWIFIVNNQTSFQTYKINNNFNKIYQQLSQSYKYYQKLLSNKPKTLPPPIIILQNLNCLFKQEVFLLKKGQQNFQNLCQLQYNLLKAEKDLKISQSIQYLQTKIFTSYINNIYIKKSIVQIVKFMTYHKNFQQNIYKKYFNIWSIFTAQESIQKVENQIVNNKYFQQKHQKLIKQKVFYNWKKLYFINKNNRY